MLNIFNYWNKKISVLTTTGEKFIGNVEDIIPAVYSSSSSSSLFANLKISPLSCMVIRSTGSKFLGKLVEFPENEIDTITIIN